MRWLYFLTGIVMSAQAQAADVTVLTYHDIADEPKQDQFAVSTANFKKQLEYLKQNKFRPISLSDFINATRRRTALPAKAVLLTFDDGLLSYQDTVVPLLKQYGYPSVLSVVSSWVDGEGKPAEYKNRLLSWEQLKQLQQQPLVEVVTHSHDLHRWVVSSPQKTFAPSAITRIYHTNLKKYESEAAFKKRIRNDLIKTRSRFSKNLGQVPVALTWPYGEYDQITMDIAREVGFRYQLTLDEGQANRFELPKIRRYMLLRDHGLRDLQAMLRQTYNAASEQRFVEFGLDVFAHVSPENHALLMQQLVNRISSLGVNTVVVTPFSEDRSKAFFPNAFLPVQHDLLNGILDKIQAQLGIEQVYLRFPESTEKLPLELFADLARNSRFNAILFDRPPQGERLRLIRTALMRFLPEVRLGSWRNGLSSLEISVVNDANRTSEKGKKVLVYVERDSYLTASGLSDALRTLRKRGIAHYGYGSLNYMAGAEAPVEVVEAMAPSIREVSR